MSEFNATVEVSKQALAAIIAAEDMGLSTYASFHADPAEEVFEVSLFNDEGGVYHVGAYKIVPA